MSDGPMCMFVLFGDGTIWGPADCSQHMHLCRGLTEQFVHCELCGAHTAIKFLDTTVVHLCDVNDAWLPILRAVGRDPRPECEHWVPIHTNLKPKA